MYSSVDWSRFAYVQYANDQAYLCNSLMFFETLHRLGSQADRVLLYPDNWIFQFDERMLDPSSQDDRTNVLALRAMKWYGVKLVPVKVLNYATADSGSSTWSSSFTKLAAFNQTQYDRVLSVDSDSLLFANLDHLFLTPSAPVAMPRAYWMIPERRTLSSTLVLLEPSAFEFDRIMDTIDLKQSNEWDMDILNDLYLDSALVLPHRQYALITGEFRAETHEKYLGNGLETWDPERAVNETKVIHFSDWPMHKPWIQTPPELREKMLPRCKTDEMTALADCRSRDLWLGFYRSFQQRRKDLCALLPEWPSEAAPVGGKNATTAHAGKAEDPKLRPPLPQTNEK
ncbi:MAG: hypothetical protein M1819_005266 [Sarea resinae]|nr:MAG: hypothetical protein M1819_005266 [Sarea resinae]